MNPTFAGTAPTLAAHSDRELIESYVSGEQHAFTLLVERYGPLVHGSCLRHLPAGAADDATQAVFVILARKAGSLRNPASLPAWLLQTARLVCRTATRDLARQRRAEEQAAMNSRPSSTPERELLWELETALDVLPERERVPLLLHFVVGQTQSRIAADLGQPENTIRSRIQRGLERLRTRLTQVGFAAAMPSVVDSLRQMTAPLPASLQRQLPGCQTTAGQAAAQLAAKSMCRAGFTNLGLWAVATVLSLVSGIAVYAWCPPPTRTPTTPPIALTAHPLSARVSQYRGTHRQMPYLLRVVHLPQDGQVCVLAFGQALPFGCVLRFASPAQLAAELAQVPASGLLGFHRLTLTPSQFAHSRLSGEVSLGDGLQLQGLLEEAQFDAEGELVELRHSYTVERVYEGRRSSAQETQTIKRDWARELQIDPAQLQSLCELQQHCLALARPAYLPAPPVLSPPNREPLTSQQVHELARKFEAHFARWPADKPDPLPEDRAYTEVKWDFSADLAPQLLAYWWSSCVARSRAFLAAAQRCAEADRSFIGKPADVYLFDGSKKLHISRFRVPLLLLPEIDPRDAQEFVAEVGKLGLQPLRIVKVAGTGHAALTPFKQTDQGRGLECWKAVSAHFGEPVSDPKALPKPTPGVALLRNFETIVTDNGWTGIPLCRFGDAGLEAVVAVIDCKGTVLLRRTFPSPLISGLLTSRERWREVADKEVLPLLRKLAAQSGKPNSEF